MREKTVYLACFILALGPAACVFAAAPNADISATGSTITIDGAKDAAWNYAPAHAIANAVSGTASKTGCSGSWRALWDSKNLYLFIDVNDNTLTSDSTGKYDDDSVEVFVDIHNDKATSYATGADDYQYRFAWDAATPAVGMDHGNTTTGIEFKLVTTGTNYAVEIAFPWTLLFNSNGAPALGDLMGFEVQINDDDDGSTRDNQLDWYSTTNDAWQNPSVIGTVALVAGYTPSAFNPKPANKATDVYRDAILSWTPGPYANTHDVYFGTTFADVNNASRTAPGAVLVSKDQDPNSYNPGRLEYGKTYYWRVDEVNAPPSTKIYKGDVWSFTVEPVSIAITGVTAEADSSFDASSVASKTVDGSGMDLVADTHGITAGDMWISGMTVLPHWIQYSFDKLYKLDQMAVWNSNQMMEGLFGLSAKSVLVQYSADGAAWTDLGTFQFTKGPGNTTCSADTKVPFGGVAAKYVKLNITSNWGGLFQQASLSEVRFYAIPVAAREPSPAPGSANLHPQVAMSWRAGRETGSHEVYVGSDANAVAASTTPTATVTAAKYDAALGLGQTYYWKVVEVNQATNPTSWSSTVWSFSTATSIAIDDFESYNNDSPKRVFQTWIDGSGFSPDEYFPNGNTGNGSGAIVGNDPQLGDIMELAYTSAGKQSMPLFYDNSTGSKISEAIRTLDPAKDTTDWSKYGLTTLVLFFRGDPANGAAPVYVKINNTKKVYGVAAATTIGFWKQWNIDLASIPVADLKAVKTITIGVGDGSAGGSGTILVDEIRLYATAPAIPVPSDPGTTGLIAYYAVNGDVLDGSGNGNNGTIAGEPGFVDGMAGFGKALALDGINDCVDLGKKDVFNPTGSFSVSLWANITAWGTSWNHVMLGNRGESGLGWQIRRHSSTSLCFTTRGADQDDTASTMIPPQNKWINIVCVYDDAASTKTIYIDGHQDKVVNTTAGKHIAATTMNTYIGARAAAGNTPEAFFTGMLDEIRLFNRALTAGEAAYLAGDR